MKQPRRKPTVRRTWRGLCGWSCLALLLVPLAPLRADSDLPLVVTTFEIDSSLFEPNGTEMDVVEQSISTFLAEQGRARFGFVRWNVEQDGTAPQAKFVLRMIEKPDLLKFDLTYAAADRPDTPIVPEETIFRSFEPDLPNHDPLKLEERLKEAIERKFENQDFRKAIQDRLLAKVSLASDVIVESRRVVLPVPGDELKAGRDSVLEVRFLADAESGQPQSGFMELIPLVRVASGDLAGLIQCKVRWFFWSPVEHEMTLWHQDIESILENKTELHVFMKTYVPDFISSDGLSDEP